MLISALCDYYDILAREGRILPEGYSLVQVRYLVSLSPSGEVTDIIDWQEKVSRADAKGKVKETSVPRSVNLFRRTQKTAIDANIVEHRPAYIFGLSPEEGELRETEKARKSHEVFVERNLEFTEGLSSPLVLAYRNFMQSWVPSEQTENPLLLDLGRQFATSGFAFCLAGHPELLLHEDGELCARWEANLSSAPADGDEVRAQCGITGQEAPIARIHDKIVGIRGGLATGNVLVGYKNPSECSYDTSQSFNSNISEAAMKKYTEALNSLLKDRRHSTAIDDVTVVFWAMDADERYSSLVSGGVFQGFGAEEDDSLGAAEFNALLKALMEDAREGRLSPSQLHMEGLNPDTEFYIAGLKPNSARLSVKFVYRRRFGELMTNIAQHQLDIRWQEDGQPVPLWKIGKELISPKSKNETVDPALSAKLLESVVCGYAYPQALLSTVVRRVKTDADTDTNSFVKLNGLRAGLIKGCLNRQARLSGKKEEFAMALDKENRDPAYLCGRLFAVLERLQQDASNNSLNRTIKDAYFASACSSPAVIFPKLLRLAQFHIPKASSGSYWNYLIGEITAGLGNEFPAGLALTEQGKFILGYYHQSYAKNEKKETVENKEEN